MSTPSANPEAANEPSKPSDASTQTDGQKGYWIVAERLGDDGQKDIHFKVVAPGCPSEQQTLKNRIERTLSNLRAIHPTGGPKFNEAFSKLLGLSQVGLVGSNPSVTVAEAALDSLQAEIVDREAGRVKNDYMLKLGRWALAFAFIAVIAYFLLDKYGPNFPRQLVYYRTFFLLWTGCMIGAWCSFASRKVVLTFFDLAQLEEDRIDPPLRLIFAGLLTSILGLVFVTGFANVVIGTFEGAKILQSGSIALLAGALSGMAEKALPAAVMQRAQSLFKSDKG
ncbi:hypothetical protein [Bradyrhizobium sp.]|uniref:hypothetical protein n=1 Tax=Bradyrhizobium sp. TaxID=376 RepID=UPI004037CDDB